MAVYRDPGEKDEVEFLDRTLAGFLYKVMELPLPLSDSDYSKIIERLDEIKDYDQFMASNLLFEIYVASFEIELSDEQLNKWASIVVESNNRIARRIVDHSFMLPDRGKQYDEVAEWLDWFADEWNGNANLMLAKLYETGCGVIQSNNKAFNYYKQASENGLSKAQYDLGRCYEYGMGTIHSYAAAYRCFCQSYSDGIEEAYEDIVRICDKVLQSEQGIGWYTGQSAFNMGWFEDIVHRAENGEPAYQYLYGVSFEEGAISDQSYSEAILWYQKSIASEYPRAMTRLGRMYYSGRGVEKSYQKAYNYFERAYDKGDKDSAYYLGLMYERGLGVEKSDGDALRYYLAASTELNADAEFHIGKMYHEGSGVKQSFYVASEWYKRAANHGHPIAEKKYLEIFPSDPKLSPFDDYDRQIMRNIVDNPRITTSLLSTKIGCSERKITYHIAKMKNYGILKKGGGSNSGLWIVLKDISSEH